MSPLDACPVRCLMELRAARDRGELRAPPVPVEEYAIERVERITPRAAAGRTTGPARDRSALK